MFFEKSFTTTINVHTMSTTTAAVVHFSDNFDWEKEEEKGINRSKRRKEKKRKQEKMAEEREARLHLVVTALMDPNMHDTVLRLYETAEYTSAAFDFMIKQAQIDTETHKTRSEQLREFRSVWPNVSDEAKATFDECLDAVALRFERRFSLCDTDTSSEDEERTIEKARLKTKFSSRWFSVNATDTLLRIPEGVGDVVVQKLPGTFTHRGPILNVTASIQMPPVCYLE